MGISGNHEEIPKPFLYRGKSGVKVHDYTDLTARRRSDLQDKFSIRADTHRFHS